MLVVWKTEMVSLFIFEIARDFLSQGQKTFYIFRVRILFAGDDVTDEDAMKALKGMAISFRIVTNHVSLYMCESCADFTVFGLFGSLWKTRNSVIQ